MQQSLELDGENTRTKEEIEKVKFKKVNRKGKKKRGKKKPKQEEEQREIWKPKSKGGMLPFSPPPKRHISSKEIPVTRHKPCHEGNVKVWTKHDLTFYGGGISRGLDTNQPSVYIDMRDRGIPITQGRGILKSIMYSSLPKAKGYLNIQTEDMSYPSLMGEDWLKIYKTLKENAPLDVICFCVGGHGRTGIALTIFGMISGALPPDTGEAIKKLRKLYCKNTVESTGQIRYINRIAIALGIEKKQITSEEASSLKRKFSSPREYDFGVESDLEDQEWEERLGNWYTDPSTII